MTESSPVLSIDEVYTAPHQKARLEAVRAKFVELYGTEPLFYARAPGRVNLIGEHVDYSGYAVLPMAIEQDMLIAVAIRDTPEIELNNLNPQFTRRAYPTLPIEIDNSKHDWGNYFLCGYKGLVDFGKIEKPVGMSLLMDGNVPPGSGLSSSSAFVCCSALATAYANGKSFSKLELAELSAKCERYVGVEGGGMDQSISFLAEKGTAKYIEFNPVRATSVALPHGGVFVIANSLVEANKYVSAGSCYNKRVVECRAAARIIAVAHNLPNARSIRTLSQLQQGFSKSLAEMALIVKSTLHTESYSKEEMAKILNISLEELQSDLLSPSTKDQEDFRLQQRAFHVYEESDLVVKYRDSSSLPVLGELMNASHYSCRDNYECSCPELDELTTISRKAGAFGSRLTGAGWGGCTVSLVAEEKVDEFIATIREQYYAKSADRLAQVEKSLFASAPGNGAAILKPNL